MRVVSHDLRSPISRIIGFADLLKKDLEGDEDLSEFAKMIVDAGWQLSNMIARIMEVEEFETEEREAIFIDVDLADSIPALIEDQREFFEKKDITLNLNIDENLIYHCDKYDLDLVINNILSNAWKFSPKGSEVSVSLKRQNNAIVLEVADQGLGFKDEEKELAFNKFSKLSAKPTNGETATGLGLHVVKVCLTRMGDSSITILDNQPEGTIIQVTFQ